MQCVWGGRGRKQICTHAQAESNKAAAAVAKTNAMKVRQKERTQTFLSRRELASNTPYDAETYLSLSTRRREVLQLR